MNRKTVFYTLGQMTLVLAALLVLPLLVDLYYGDGKAYAFAITIGISLAVSGLLMLTCRTKDNVIYAKEGFVIVTLTWLMLSALGALPFVLSGEIEHYYDAFFETVSGFTTTGASIIRDVGTKGLSAGGHILTRGIQFWRCFTHWVGGMGVLVFIMAIVPKVSDRSIHIVRAEMPGPVIGKLVPKMKSTAKILYLIYMALTALEAIFLFAGGDMSFYESLLHAFGTAGTGGFGLVSTSIGGYSPYTQWVIAVFMMLFGVNFNLYFLLLIKKFKPAIKNCELWTYFGIIGASTAAIAIGIRNMCSGAEETIRTSFFQVSSIVTTTGYGTTNINAWTGFPKALVLILFFIGGCAGSTAGGLKVSRAIILVKMIRKEVRHILHPRSVNIVSMDGKAVEAETQKNVGNYFTLYIFSFIAIFLVISALNSFTIETNFSAAASCFNNVGPAFGSAASHYADFTPVSKIVLSIAMLLGRLELFPILVLFVPSTWTK